VKDVSLHIVPRIRGLAVVTSVWLMDKEPKLTLEMCAAAPNRKQSLKLRTLESSRSIKIIDVDTPRKLVTSACFTPIATHFSVAWSVCQSVVCYVRAPNRQIWICRIHLRAPMTCCVRRESLTHRKREDLERKPLTKICNCKLLLASGE